MDLCRQILIEIESWPTTLAPTNVEIEGYTADDVGYNASLLAQQGLIEGRRRGAGAGCAVHGFAPRCLTDKGHDFLEHARNDTRWERTKDILANNGGPMTIQAMKTILESLTKAAVEGLTKAGMGL